MNSTDRNHENRTRRGGSPPLAWARAQRYRGAAGLAWQAMLVLALLGPSAGCGDDDGATPWTPCTDATDLDQDGYGPGCPMGEDCDDSAPGITGACQSSGCPEGFVLVPAGTFEMGCDIDDFNGLCANSTGAGPAHPVTLDSFCIERTEVTLGDYRTCLQAGVCLEAPEEAIVDLRNYAFCNYTPEPGARERHPVNCVSKNMARRYCQEWLGGDLPTEAQWEMAARGTDSYLYPWGNSPPPDCSLANCSAREDGFGCNEATPGDGKPGTWEVGSAPDGASPYGALDMSGNVAEWVLDCYDESTYASCAQGCSNPYFACPDFLQSLIWRGGTFPMHPALFALELSAIARTGNVDDRGDGLRRDTVGFRCVRGLQ